MKPPLPAANWKCPTGTNHECPTGTYGYVLTYVSRTHSPCTQATGSLRSPLLLERCVSATPGLRPDPFERAFARSHTALALSQADCFITPVPFHGGLRCDSNADKKQPPTDRRLTPPTVRRLASSPCWGTALGGQS